MTFFLTLSCSFVYQYPGNTSWRTRVWVGVRGGGLLGIWPSSDGGRVEGYPRMNLEFEELATAGTIQTSDLPVFLLVDEFQQVLVLATTVGAERSVAAGTGRLSELRQVHRFLISRPIRKQTTPAMVAG